MSEQPVSGHDPLRSPCVRNCCLNDEDVCLGCGRTLVEITAWHTATDDEKRQILVRCRARQAELTPYFRR